MPQQTAIQWTTQRKRPNFTINCHPSSPRPNKKTALIIGGDFNAKTKQETQNTTRSTAIGNFAKNKINENGELLIEFAEMNYLKLTNTFFKHRPAHTTTWQCPQRRQEIIDANSGTIRRNPYRNQIDYILTRKSNNLKILDSRSYGGFACNSDHKPVIAKVQLKWKTNIQKKPTTRINSQEINKTKESLKQYQEQVRQNMKQNKPSNIQEKWDSIKQSTMDAAIKVTGYKQKQKYTPNKRIQELSAKQKQLLDKINSTACKHQQKSIKTERNKVLNEIHKEIKKEENRKISAQMKPIESMPDDPNRTYKAIKQLKRMKRKTQLLIKTENGLTANEETQTKLISKYFKEQFFKNAD